MVRKYVPATAATTVTPCALQVAYAKRHEENRSETARLQRSNQTKSRQVDDSRYSESQVLVELFPVALPQRGRGPDERRTGSKHTWGSDHARLCESGCFGDSGCAFGDASSTYLEVREVDVYTFPSRIPSSLQVLEMRQTCFGYCCGSD